MKIFHWEEWKQKIEVMCYGFICQKLRTLYLMEILLERTDDEHMLNASELCTILDQEYGISTDRRTIYTEMEILDKFGLDVQQKKGKIPRHTGQNAITEGDLECILTKLL